MAKDHPIEKQHKAHADQLKGLRVSWQGGKGRIVSLMADLNLGGMSVEAPNPPALGTIVDLLFENPDQEIRARAVVRRIVPGQGMDVEFMGMGMDDRARFRALLRSAEKSKRPGKIEEAPLDDPGEPFAPPVVPVQQTSLAEIPQTVPAAGSWPGRRERRGHLRHKTGGIVELAEAGSGKRFEAHLVNIGREGCHVKTAHVVPVGMDLDIQIAVGKETLHATARVVYVIFSQGIGLLFTKMEPESSQILEKWMGTLLESAWLIASRRRSQRMTLVVPVEIRGQDSQGERFAERTKTIRISPHGAAVLLSAAVTKGMRLTLLNPRTRSEVECVIVHMVKDSGGNQEVGLSFTLPTPAFWKVAFPPPDWSPRHLDAKRAN